MTDPQPAQSSSHEVVAVQATANDDVALLKDQAEALRAELAQLRQNLKQVKGAYTSQREAELREANEALVIAALHSESIADAAMSSLTELARAAQRDTLTDTPNRALMLDRVAGAISLARRHGTHIALLFLDLDDFKRINDTLGHAVGDALLQVAARRLETVVRDSDTVSRHGGDEFLVLVNDIAHAADAALVARKILAAFAVPAQLGEHMISLSASIGIAIFPQDGEDAATLITRADAAMYAAKGHAGGSFQLYSEVPSGDVGQQSNIRAPALTGESKDSAAARSTPQIQHLREANEQLVLAALTAQDLEERAEDKHRRQVKFMAMVAHELRNPLNPIRTAAALLKRAREDEAMLANLQSIIERQIVHMAQLVDDLLDASRGSIGKFRLASANIDMVEVLRAAVEACSPAIDARRQRLSLQFPIGPIAAIGDATRLAQVFSNLLDNSSKYTPEGGQISLSLVTEGETIVITVADTGIGLTQEVLPHIFELFVQEDHAVRHHGGGLGIGLAIVRDLVEAHGGTVVAKSRGRGLGSEFIVRLPMAKTQA